MMPQYRMDKSTQAAAMLLRLNGGSMNYMKLIKLLYLIDREALLQWGRPVTFDSYVSMRHGPVLSATLDLINEAPLPTERSCWHQYISEPAQYSVRLREGQQCPDDELSEAEIALIRKVFEQYRELDEWRMVEEVHKLPEWQDPGRSAIPIEYRDILMAGGKTRSEAAAICDEIESLALSQILLR